MDGGDEQVVVSGSLSYQEKPLSAYQVDHTTTRIFVLSILAVIAITIVATFVVFGFDAANQDTVQATREIATAVITGLIGVLAGASLKHK